MRILVCLLLAAVLGAGCSTPHKRHTKGPTAQRTSKARAADAKVKTAQPTAAAPAPTPPPPAPETPSDQGPAPASTAQPAAAQAASPPVATADDGTNSDIGGTTGPGGFNPHLYRLGSGDIVHIDVFNEPELSLDAGIDGMGSINYPLLGHIQAGGMTPRELETALTDQLRQGYLVSPSVRVSIRKYRPIFVMGMVRRVGSHPYSPGLTVEKALVEAGGISEYGSTKKIYVQHPGMSEKEKEKVNLDYILRPGDTIMVEERLF